MNKIADFTKAEKEKYGKIYAEVINAVDNIKDFIDEKSLRERKFYGSISILKEYLRLIEDTDRECDKKGILDVFRSDEKYKTKLEDYKLIHEKQFNQLQNCSNCVCLNCTSQCNFDSCLGCRQNSKLVQCDHRKTNLRVFNIHADRYTVELRNDRTGIINKYTVMAVIQNLERDKKYIFIQNVQDAEEKYILYFYPGISEDTYGEITDGEEFDEVVSLINSHMQSYMNS